MSFIPAFTRCLLCAALLSACAAPARQPTSAAPTGPSAGSAASDAAASRPLPIPSSGTNALGGRIFNIEPGIACNALASFLQPGDEVRLLPGVHIPFELADLRGERDKPIIIRGYQPEADKPLPYVKGDLYSIRLLRPSNVIVRDLLLGNSTGPTIFVDGSIDASPVVQEVPWEANLILANLSIRQDNAAANQSAIYLRSIAKADISHLMVKGWNSSAIVLDGCRRVGVAECILDSAGNLPQYHGVAIRSGCEDISCMYVSFGARVQVAFELGVCDPAEPSSNDAAQNPARRILISHNAALESPCFVSLGSVDNASIVNNSIIESIRCVWRADGQCGVPNFITFENNLVTWVPGRMDRISDVASGIPPESIRLQRNLWWSEELPAAFEIVGKPFGAELAPQVLDINPKVEMHGFVPVEARARGFGWNDGVPHAPGAAPSPQGTPVPKQKQT